MNCVVDRIREEMNLNGLKQKDFIKILNEKQSNVSKYLSLNEKIRLDIPNTVLARIADTLDVDIEYLLCMQDNKRVINAKNATQVEIMTIKAGAGVGNGLIGIDEFSTGKTAMIDNMFFKTIPQNNLKCMQVDGYSMLPMLSHESWVIYREVDEFETDGLYIINYDNQLMVKMVQINFTENKLDIISLNKEYQSYSISKGNQTVCRIVGRVLRSIV